MGCYMSDLEGVMLSDYLLLQCISKGGLADVYRARQNGDGNYEVAVKVYRSGYAQEESFRNYFMAEAEKIGQFDHPNILPLLEFGEGEGLLYIVTPFVTAGTLENLLMRVGGKFSALQALPIMQQLCSAVQYTHNADVIHGNIKPTNVFVAADGRMLLSDFGVARGYDDSQQSLTRIGWGSAEYAAPEQSLGVLRRASDIYALGTLLFRILTGQPPFRGQTPVEVLLKHVREQPPPARMFEPGISDAVDGVLRKAMQKRSDDRFASAEELSNAFLAAVTIGDGFSLPCDPNKIPVLRDVAFSGRSRDESVQQVSSPINAGSGAIGPVGAAMGKTGTGFLAENAAVSNQRFWSVDPVEWSPIGSIQAQDVTSADAYMSSKPVMLEAVPAEKRARELPAPQTGSSQGAAPNPTPPPPLRGTAGNRLNEGLRKALPVVVVILLLLGLAGALLSSFYFP